MDEMELLNKQLEKMRMSILKDPTDISEDDMFKHYLDNAKYIALDVLYPFDLDATEVPLRIALDWQVRCALELYGLDGENGYISYSENGLAWTKDSDGLSRSLLNELTPKAGVPR